MCVRKEGGNRRSCVHEGQSSIRWVFFSLRRLSRWNKHCYFCLGVPSLWLVVQREVWEQCRIFWPQPRSDDSGGPGTSNSGSFTFLHSGPKKKFAQLLIFVVTWSWSFQLSWRRPKPRALFLQGFIFQILLKWLDFFPPGWLWLARFRTRPFRHIRNIQFTFLIAFKTVPFFFSFTRRRT